MPGGTRHYDFGKELVKRGHNVTIFASSFHYSQHKEMKLFKREKWKIENVDGINFVWLKTFPYQKNDWRRVINMISYMFRSYWLGRKIPKINKNILEPDVVFGSSVHLLAVLSAYWLAKYYRAKFIMEIRDLWPQGLIDIGALKEKSLIVKVLRFLEKFLYKKAQEIIVLALSTKDYLSSLRINLDKVHFVPNGVDVSRYKLSGYNKNKEDKRMFKIVYAGALGVVNALSPALEVAKIIEERGLRDIKFIFIGSGVEKPRLIKKAGNLNLNNVEFRNPVPKTQMPTLLNQADVLLLVENKILYGSSNKLMDYMAAAKPIIFSTPASHNTVEEAGCGLSVSPGDSEELAEAVIKFYQMVVKEREKIGERGREYVEKYHNVPVLVDKLEKVIKEVINE